MNAEFESVKTKINTDKGREIRVTLYYIRLGAHTDTKEYTPSSQK